MTRQEIFDQVTERFGMVPDWVSGLSDAELEHEWARLNWLLSDTGLTSREKALVGFAAASAVHCPY